MEVSLTPINDHAVGLKFANQAEAREFLADAAPAQDAVRAQLASVHAHEPRLNDDLGMPLKSRKTYGKRANAGKGTGAVKKVGGAKPRAEKRPLGRKPTTSASSDNRYQRIPCQYCQKPVARSQMKKHLKSKHYQEYLATEEGSPSSE